ncbi:MAG: hypothetical protein M1820_003457 [Bogoriella megaspora]|nr:MAG: hypothetical protein M1820_003457 [Bogoriella megaspora]
MGSDVTFAYNGEQDKRYPSEQSLPLWSDPGDTFGNPLVDPPNQFTWSNDTWAHYHGAIAPQAMDDSSVNQAQSTGHWTGIYQQLPLGPVINPGCYCLQLGQLGAKCTACYTHELNYPHGFNNDLLSPSLARNQITNQPSSSASREQSSDMMEIIGSNEFPLEYPAWAGPNPVTEGQYSEDQIMEPVLLAEPATPNSPNTSDKDPSMGSWVDVQEPAQEPGRNPSPDVNDAVSSHELWLPKVELAGYSPTEPYPKTIEFSNSERGQSPESSSHSPFPDAPTPNSAEGYSTAKQASRKASLPKPKKGKVSKRRQLNSEERKNASTVRRIGACVRCRMFKLKCDGSNPCSRCLYNQDRARNFHEPCFRSNFEEVRVVRHGNALFDQHDVAFLSYAWCDVYVDSKVLDLTWSLPSFVPGYQKRIKPRLQVSNCREFRTNEEHPEHVKWQTGGRVFAQELPPYAVDDTESLRRRVSCFMDSSQEWVEDHIINSQTDEVSRMTYYEARRWRQKNDSKLINAAFRLQCGSVMCQGWGSITGDEDLGIPAVDFTQYGPSQYDAYQSDVRRPIPQTIDHQIDVAMLWHMRGIEKELVKELKKKIFKFDMKSWYEIFLCYFIILANLEWIHKGAKGYMESQRQTKTIGQVSYIIRRMTEEWEFSMKNMLYHFRVILRGMDPFELARYEQRTLQNNLGLDEEAVRYMSRVARMVEDQGMSLSPTLVLQFLTDLRSTTPAQDKVYERFAWC